MSVRITTNNVPRLLIDDYQLSEKEREQFDYLNWEAIKAGEDSASFFRYRGTLYDLGEFQSTSPGPWNHGLPSEFAGWDGYSSDSFFSGIVVRIVADDNDYVVVGTFYSED